MARIDYKISLLVFVGLVLFSELLLTLLGGSYWRAVGKLELVSPALTRDQFHAWKKDTRKTLVLIGDSVFYGSALRAAKIKDWKKLTPAAWLSSQPAWQDWRVLDLSADGMLLTDMEQVLEKAIELKPDRIAVEVNYRMFSERMKTGNKARAYAWLAGGPSLPDKAAPGEKPSNEEIQEIWASSHLLSWVRLSRLFRYSELIHQKIWAPSPSKVMAAWVENIFGGVDEDALDEDVQLRYRVRPYYASPAMAPDHEGLVALKRMATRLDASGIPSLLFLTPQNGDYVGDFLNKKAYSKNRAAFAALPAAASLRVVDWAALKPVGEFLDHCHLDARGNRWLADRLTEALNGN